MTMLTWAGHDMTTPQLVYKWFKQQSDEQIAVLAAHNVWYGPAHLRPRREPPQDTAPPEIHIPIRWSEFAEPSRPIFVAEIVEACARFAGVTVAEMQSPSRAHYLCIPRQAAMYIAATHTERIKRYIGGQLGGRDHATILHGQRKVQADLDADGAIFGAIVAHVERELGVG